MSDEAVNAADYVLPILEYPDPALAQVCEDAEPGDDIRDLLVRMLVTIGPRPDSDGRWTGAGLAAPQVGRNVRAIVVHDDVTGQVWAMLNPRIVERSGTTTTEPEACLSCPGITVPVTRSWSVRVVGLTAGGEPLDTGLVKGFVARTFQHEIDHLNGVTLAMRTPPRRKRAMAGQHGGTTQQ